MSARLLIAFAWGCVGAVLAYASLRALQLVFFREPNPALVFYSAHSGFYWRALTAGYLGGMCAFLAWLAAERAERFLPRAIVIVAVAACAQAAFLP